MSAVFGLVLIEIIVFFPLGFGPVSEVVSFTTSPEGYPGSPSQLSIQRQDVNAVLICWDASLVGGPFEHYTVTWMMSNGSVWSVDVDITDLEAEECTLGATVSMCPLSWDFLF